MRVVNGVLILDRLVTKIISPYKGKKHLWSTKFICYCQECDNIFERHPQAIRDSTIRCVCSTVLEDNLSAKRLVFKQYKRLAKERNLKFDLDFKHFCKLITSNCEYCGCKPQTRMQSKNWEFYYNGIDRLDTKKGYTKENSVTCCKHCNKAKWDYSLEEFEKWLLQTHKYYQETKWEQLKKQLKNLD